MTTTYNRRVHAIVTAEDRTACEAALAALLGDTSAVRFTAALSPTGEEPATHYGASAQVPVEVRNLGLALFAPGNPQGRRAWRGEAYGVDQDVVKLSPGDATPADTANVRWTWARCLADAGLQAIRPLNPITGKR